MTTLRKKKVYSYSKQNVFLESRESIHVHSYREGSETRISGNGVLKVATRELALGNGISVPLVEVWLMCVLVIENIPDRCTRERMLDASHARFAVAWCFDDNRI